MTGLARALLCLFLATEEGDVFVVRAGPPHELLATNSVGEPVVATPAVSG